MLRFSSIFQIFFPLLSLGFRHRPAMSKMRRDRGTRHQSPDAFCQLDPRIFLFPPFFVKKKEIQRLIIGNRSGSDLAGFKFMGRTWAYLFINRIGWVRLVHLNQRYDNGSVLESIQYSISFIFFLCIIWDSISI